MSSGRYSMRFYEKDPGVKFTVEFLLAFPPSIQSIVSNGFSRMAIKDHKANLWMQNLKSLGTEKVLALYALKKKRRAYDQNPETHQAMAYLFVLPPEGQKAIVSKLNELLDFVQDYLKECRSYNFLPQREMLEKITDTYVEHGAPAATMLLKAIHVSLSQPNTPPKDAATNTTSALETIQGAETGLRIKGDTLQSENK
jgi:hypothetical protein